MLGRAGIVERQGFTLVELSIVLVILGLLIGGVMSGQHLIKAAELRSVPAQWQEYTVAFNTFKMKYNALPGDFSKATTYWAAAHATNATCLTTTRTTASTCNGDGDNDIDYGGYEPELAWEQLSLSGIISGTYKGYPTPTTGTPSAIFAAQLGVTAPISKISGVGWSLLGSQAANGWANGGSYNIWPGRYGTQLNFQTIPETTISYASIPVGSTALSSSDAFAIDAKADDGKPGTGAVRGLRYGGSANQCTDTVTPSAYYTAIYYTVGDNRTPYCNLMFDMGM